MLFVRLFPCLIGLVVAEAEMFRHHFRRSLFVAPPKREMVTPREVPAALLRGSQRKSYAFTFLVELLLLLTGLVTLKLTGDLLGTVGFGEYAVARRAISLVTFPLLFGLGISIPRYIALSGSSDRPEGPQAAYFLAGFVIAGPILLVFSGLVTALSAPFAGLFFGTTSAKHLTLPMVLAVVGLYIHSMVYGYYRGRLQIWTANLLHLVNLGILPPLAVVLWRGSAANVIAATGIGWIGVGLVAGLWAARGLAFAGISRVRLAWCVRELLRYGAPRVPGELALFGLFAVPTFLVAHNTGVENAGFFSLSLSLLQAITSIFAGASVVLLPIVSQMMAEGNWERVTTITSKTLKVSLALVVLMVGAVELSLGAVVFSFLGESFSPVVEHARWVLPGAIPYVIYLILRSPLDALVVWPHNSINLAIALGTAVALLWFGEGYVSASVGVMHAFLVLGILSLLSWWKTSEAAAGGKVARVERRRDQSIVKMFGE